MSISTYHEYILEAIYSLRQGLSFHKEAKNVQPDVGSDQTMIVSEIFCRYSFLMIANSLEAAANALLLSLKFDQDYHQDLEKVGTLLKFKLFCSFHGKKLDQGDMKFASVKEVINCRNEFVHPKPKIAQYDIVEDGSPRFENRKSKKYYPNYFSEIKPTHVLTSLKDTLKFLSWVCFDVCGLGIEEGALILGLGSYGSAAHIDLIEDENNISFDKRTFGQK